MQKVQVKLRESMERKGLPTKTVEQVLQAITSFALYGFPESHAISFALLAYGSAYLKVHRAPEFYASLLNNQPMGFYSSATLIKDAQRHGVEFRSVNVQTSQWRCTIDKEGVVQLGLCVVKGLNQTRAQALVEEREKQPFTSLNDFKKRTALARDELRTLAEIGALNGLARHRREALWEVEKMLPSDDLFAVESGAEMEAISPLSAMSLVERIHADYAGTQLTLAPHPMALLRTQHPDVWRAADLVQAPHGTRVRIGGNVICRQRPGTAKGVVFISLEDETGIANAIVTAALFEKLRLLITQENFLVIEGPVQARQGTIHIKAEQIEPLRNHALIGSGSHDFH
jgi:error-prone DNA polymerase